MNNTIYTCPVCGKMIEETTEPGRPRTYCNKECAEIWKKWNYITTHLPRLCITSEAEKRWKGMFLRERNLIFKG